MNAANLQSGILLFLPPSPQKVSCMLECGLRTQCINKTTIRNNYWISFFLNFPLSKQCTHFFNTKYISFFIMFWVNRNLNRIALRYVIKIQVRLNGGHFPYLSSVTLWAVLPSHVIPVRGTRKQNRNNNYISSPSLFRSGKTYTEKP